MSTASMYHAINQSNWGYFEPVRDQYEEKLDGLVKGIDKRLPGVLRESLLEYSFLFPKDTQLRLEIVLDTNILFKQVLGHLKGYSSPLPDMTRSEFLVLYAPPELRDEIHAKIEEKVRKEGQARAKLYAEGILSHVTFVNRISRKVRAKAQELLISRDPDDIAFLAVTFQKDTHGVLTQDLDFEVAENVRIWTFGRMGNVVSSFRRGSFCLWFFARGLPLAFKMLAGIIAVIFKSIVSLGRLIAGGLSWIGNKLVSTLQKIPSELALIVAMLSLLAISLSQELQKKIEQGINHVKQWITDFAKQIVMGIERFIQPFRDMLLIIIHYSPRIVEILGYMAYDAVGLIEMVKNIEESRPSGASASARSLEELLTEVESFLQTL